MTEFRVGFGGGSLRGGFCKRCRFAGRFESARTGATHQTSIEGSAEVVLTAGSCDLVSQAKAAVRNGGRVGGHSRRPGVATFATMTRSHTVPAGISSLPRSLPFQEVFPSKISSLPRSLPFQEVFSVRGVVVRVVVGFRLSSKLFRASPSGDSKGLARDSRRVQLGGTRGEGVAVQNSRVSVFRGMSEKPVGGESPIKARGFEVCGTRKPKGTSSFAAVEPRMSHVKQD